MTPPRESTQPSVGPTRRMRATPATPVDSPTAKSNRRGSSKTTGLELLRFLCAMSVLAFHYLWYGAASGQLDGPHPSPGLLAYGGFAVQAFFVISGYLIAYSTEGRTARAFAAARIGRLWPAMAVCAAVSTLVTGTQLSTFAEASALLPMLYEGGLVDPSYWSLVIELRFYLWVYILLWLCQRLPNVDALCVVWMAVSAYALSSPLHEATTLTPYSAYFIFGMLFYSHERGSRRALWLLAPALMLASVQTQRSLGRIDNLAGVPGPPWTGAAIAGAILLVTFAMRIDLPVRWRRVALTLGAMTYPLYLIHQAVGYKLIGWLTPWLGFPMSAATATGCALGFAWVVSHAIEPRLRPRVVALLAGSEAATRTHAR